LEGAAAAAPADGALRAIGARLAAADRTAVRIDFTGLD